MSQLSAPKKHPGNVMEANQYLTFTLAKEEYGVEVLKVQEIKGLSVVTPIPNTPTYVRGVMNLRGVIVPVIDLRMKFGFEQVPHDKFTVIIVIVLAGRVTGLIVDTVSDVLDIRRSDIQAPPDINGRIDTSFISGMAQVGERLVILLDIEKMLYSEERARIASESNFSINPA